MFNMFVSKSLDIHSILSNLFQPCSMLTIRNFVLISNTTLDVTVEQVWKHEFVVMDLLEYLESAP